MSTNACIFVAAESVDDATLVRKMLREEFEQVVASTDPQRAPADFDRHRPAVLVLAFESLEKAERHYLGLFRRSTVIHALPHRTVILCNKDDVHRAYALCRKDYFDDYVLFWPLSHDAPRLPMAVHHALRQLDAAAADTPSAREFADPARRLVALHAQLEQQAASAGEHIEGADRSLRQARQEIGMALDGFSHRLAQGQFSALVEVKDAPGLQREFERLKAGEIAPRLEHAAAAVRPVRDWSGALLQDLARERAAAQALNALNERVRRRILVVDGDEFQHRLLHGLLADQGVDLAFAASAAAALAALRRQPPDLLLMDVGLPDLDGIELTRRVRAIERFAGLPIVMITGDSARDVVLRSVEAGATGFLVKPFGKETLLARIRDLLGEDVRPS